MYVASYICMGSKIGNLQKLTLELAILCTCVQKHLQFSSKSWLLNLLVKDFYQSRSNVPRRFYAYFVKISSCNRSISSRQMKTV